jgi:4-diphosphocytidyl-2-methyl-D-erithritol synthase
MINKTAAIIAAAGIGHRLGANLPKSLVKLIDKTLLEHAVANLAPVAQLLIVTAPAGYEKEYKKLLGEEVEVITGVFCEVTVLELRLQRFQIIMSMCWSMMQQGRLPQLD